MEKIAVVVGSLAMLAMTLWVCGGQQKGSQRLKCASFLPDKVDPGEVERSSEVRTYSGESLYEYIDGGAELYHEYGFVEVATANYRQDGKEVVVDIYGFDKADHAYGLYASFRPPDPQPVQFGADGFGSPSSIDFVKGPFVVRVIGFDESAETQRALETLASEIDGILPVGDDMPAVFSVFPRENVIDATEMIYAGPFLGYDFLIDIYTRRYLVDGDTLTLFLTADEDGEKFGRWFELGAADGSAIPGDPDLPFDDGRVFELSHPRYGTIICGLKGEYLLGVAGFKDENRGFLTGWLNSLL